MLNFKQKKCAITQIGFTLLELLFVVLIIGILLLVALPSYQAYIVKANRTDAKQSLSEIMFEQERYQLHHRTYTTNLSALGFRVQGRGVSSAEGFYSITAHACPGMRLDQCVELRASPNYSKLPKSERPLTLDSRDQRQGEW